MENQEIDEDLFKRSKPEKNNHDLGKITIHNDQEMDLLIKYLEELEAGNETYRPADALKFEK
jgi:hypothetical protein